MDDSREDPTRKTAPALFDALATTDKPLSKGNRLELLTQGERRVDALAKAAGLGLTIASAPLQTLKQAGLVTTLLGGAGVWGAGVRHAQVASPSAGRVVHVRRGGPDGGAIAVPAPPMTARGYSGTADVVAYAQETGVPVRVLWSKGAIR
ncbi:hypothetical protein [Streptomyces sp. BK340]|uniref:hypothetical protein n=1 Tax=Streptomyces sp. BK340 TaxID=2572903 RepID=UPI0011AC21DD|nr:hypothetical protein [Streptomyces sp. BK340]TVZ75578.1 hypothetical protein FB157_15310 [Streptomyces sp. BK340]